MATRSKKATPATRQALEEYRRKRDFGRTAEPSGDVETGSRGRGLLFVIQKHAASHLHYDLRLELDGVMRSWAVPKGPSLDPAVKRLAMQVEDHPVSYNTFEGTIPKGEYGGGTVMLWDRGTYSPDEPEPGEDEEAAVRRGLKAGKLAFTFQGERLQGSFALVRTERGPKPKWLLIKHRDGTARDGVEITEEVVTSVASGRTMKEIAAERDRVWRSNRGGSRGGEEAGSGAEASSDVLTPTRPTPARALPKKGRWTYEPWYGGERVLAYVTPDATNIIDEHGNDVTRRHRRIAEELASLAERLESAFVIEGEIADDTLFASDLLLRDGVAHAARPREERRAELEALLKRRRVQGVKLIAIDTAGGRALERATAEGDAGIIARRTDAVYEPGVKSSAVLRIATR